MSNVMLADARDIYDIHRIIRYDSMLLFEIGDTTDDGVERQMKMADCIDMDFEGEVIILTSSELEETIKIDTNVRNAVEHGKIEFEV